MSAAEILKLRDALSKSPFQAFKVMHQPMDEGDDYNEWDIEPLLGPTLARQYVQGPFEGTFLIAAKVVTPSGPILDCYLDIVLPERICENCYLRDQDRITRSRGRRVGQGRAVPTIAIEQFGIPQLYFAKENPAFGIDVLRKGLNLAREKRNIAYDLAVLLRDARRYSTRRLKHSRYFWRKTPLQILRTRFISRDLYCMTRLGNTTKLRKTNDSGRLLLPRRMVGSRRPRRHLGNDRHRPGGWTGGTQ